jgi:hypothetical protein
MKINHELYDNIRKGWRCYEMKDTIGNPTERKLKVIYYRLGKDVIVDEQHNILYIKERRD